MDHFCRWEKFCKFCFFWLFRLDPWWKVCVRDSWQAVIRGKKVPHSDFFISFYENWFTIINFEALCFQSLIFYIISDNFHIANSSFIVIYFSLEFPFIVSLIIYFVRYFYFVELIYFCLVPKFFDIFITQYFSTILFSLLISFSFIRIVFLLFLFLLLRNFYFFNVLFSLSLFIFEAKTIFLSFIWFTIHIISNPSESEYLILWIQV